MLKSEAGVKLSLPYVWWDACPSLAVVVLNASIVAAGVARSCIGYRSDDFWLLYQLIALFWLVGWALHALGAHRIGAVGQTFAVFAMLSVTTTLAGAVLATTARPYADTLFAAADSRLLFGLSWPDMIKFFAGWPVGLRLLSAVYSSLNWQPLTLIAILCLLGRRSEAWTFISANALALAVCLLVFPWLPAVGGYAHFGIGPEAVPTIASRSAWNYPVVLEGLRNGTIAELDLRALTGVIAMPSFHAASAILLGSYWFRIRFFGIAGVVLNCLMWVSAVPVGGHYVVDVLGGSLVAWAALVTAARLHGTRFSRARLTPPVSHGLLPGFGQAPAAIAASSNS